MNSRIDKAIKPSIHAFVHAEGQTMALDARRIVVDDVAAALVKGSTHTFRHAYCSFLANNNVPPLMAMKIMGHSPIDIIMIYYHVDEHDLMRVFGKLNFGAMLARPNVGPDDTSGAPSTAA